VIDGRRHISAEAYGFNEADMFYLYLPGKKADGLPAIL
jgi:hypothetical protein